ncbi:hypothetical protein BaRGS_00020647 [Batillaria attramentaria]|uniref:Uncharacterized protein n=1 Tax=Batillaria attramentaria TaxID=370345 RepID=A0ABD0KLV1_9CAEN
MAAAVEVSDSQRLIAVSLGKIAASRSQRGGINLHKNLLVATVLHKARTIYMMEHLHVAARQRAQQAPSPLATTTTTTSSPPPSPSVNAESSNNVVSTPAAASPSLTAPLATVPHTSHAEVSRAETGSASENADVSRVQMEESSDDKENTPPPAPSPLPDTASSNLDCEMRLQKDSSSAAESKDLKDKNGSSASLSHAQQIMATRDYVSSGKSCSSCLLKRRRATDRDNENGVAPKVRILECRVSTTTITTDSTPEPMQVESPQISNLVNIFNTGFSGLCPNGTTTTTDSNGRSHVSQLSTVSPILASHKLASESNMMCGKQMKACLDSVPQPIALTV